MAVVFIISLFLLPLKINAASPSLITIDTPPNGAVVNNALSYTIKGWALNSSGVREVDVKIDNSTYKKAAYGLSRTDVARVYPSYRGAASSGFSYTIGAGALGSGWHTIYVKAIGNNWTYTVAKRTFQTVSLSPRVCLDTPTANATYFRGDSINFSGWALNATGIRNVDIYIDNVKYSASYGLSRNDVANAFPYYPNNVGSGFSRTIQANSLSNGTHTVLVNAIGNNGVSVKISRTFTVKTPEPKSAIDIPAANSVLDDNKDIIVSGWAINWNGIKQVDIYADNSTSPLVSTQANISRTDVNRVYPQYVNSAFSGYNATLPISGFSNGSHSVKVVAIGNDGTSSTLTRTFNIQRYQMKLDAVPNYLNTTLSISGWALNASSVNNVDLYIDGTYKASAKTGLKRTDVPSTYSSYPDTTNSGFSFSDIDIKSLSVGKHEIKIAAFGKDGSKQVMTFSATKQAPITVIEQPSNNISTGGVITVKGFALNATGLSEVNVSVDNGTKSPMNIVANSSPVGKYSGYLNISSSGFTAQVDITNYNTGKHTITVTAVGQDGTTSTTSINVYNRGAISYTPYSQTLASMINTQLSLNPGPAYYYSGWKYISTTPNGYYYYKYNSNGSYTYTRVAEAAPYPIYNTIYSQFVKYLNPKSFIANGNIVNNNTTDLYQFMRLTYVDGVSAAGLNSFFSSSGVLSGMGQYFINSGKKYNVNPVYLAMHCIEETGNGTSFLARGVQVSGGKYTINGVTYTTSAGDGVYHNLFGINAYDSNANLYGAKYAMSKGWNSIPAAIDGGAEWISRNYINTRRILGYGINQDTLYKMRWNPEHPGSYQYATDLLWAHNSAAYIKQYYDKYTSSALTFDVPQYAQ